VSAERGPDPGAETGRIRIVSSPIDPAALFAEARLAGAGAVVQFIGTVRDHTDRAEVTQLHYEAYSEMAERTLSEIVREAAASWPVRHASVVHRVGTLAPTDITVCVTVSAAHRDAAFAACRHIIDTLKARAPIWKRETLQSGARRWVEESRPPVDRRDPI
jgi:molybdopterin synthase catalytic subunit